MLRFTNQGRRVLQEPDVKVKSRTGRLFGVRYGFFDGLRIAGRHLERRASELTGVEAVSEAQGAQGRPYREP